jgi:hypothetical protein
MAFVAGGFVFGIPPASGTLLCIPAVELGFCVFRKQHLVQGPGDKTTKADPLEAFCSGFQGSFIRILQLVYAYFNAY